MAFPFDTDAIEEMTGSVVVYIAGPMHSSGKLTENIHNAIQIAKQLKFQSNHKIVPFIPHLFAFWDFMDPQDGEYWLSLDRAMLLRSQAMYVLPGYSMGVQYEISICHENEKPMFDTVESTLKWVEDNAY